MSESVAARAPRMRLSLQSRLMLTVIGIVSLILIVVAIVTSAVLGGVLERQSDEQLRTAAEGLGHDFQLAGPNATAYEVLASGRQQPGFLLTVNSDSTSSGAWVSGPATVSEITAPQLDTLNAQPPGQFASLALGADLGDYRVVGWRSLDGSITGAIGLPLSEVRSTIGAMLSTIVLITLGGLMLLAIATAFVIRVSLRPLRAVADTATRVASLPLAEGSVSIAERVPEDQTDDRTEIGRVGAALNTLLDHVGSSLAERQRNEERMRSFVADASHELRTPLASIRGYSELSLRDPSLSEGTASALERIQAQSLRMTTLVEDLLLLARLDEGQELVFGSVDLTRLAIESITDARPAGPDHHWTLDVGEEPVVVAGDATRLHQVAANLLANARTHTPAGTTVTVSVARDGDSALLRVHDDGPGVDPAVAKELFERFSRADRSRARKTGGTGLGLSIARAIVQAHHGELSVTSIPGDTTFDVRLPARPLDPAARREPVSSR